MLEGTLRKSVVNLGCLNAGTDVFALDASVIDICKGAEATIVQVTGAQNNSNRFYSVHPRRNDRFLRPTRLLKEIYKNVDLTDVHFTRHLLAKLSHASPEKFALVKDELKKAWVSRMQMMLDRIGGKIILLWLANHSPDSKECEQEFCPDPVFVDRNMLDRLSDQVAAIVEVVATREEVLAGRDRMQFTPLDAFAVKEMLGPVVHEIATRKLAHAIEKLH